MIKCINNDITTVTSGILIHGVNAQHAMASGVAKAIKDKWPEVYDVFMASPKGPEMLGTVCLVKPEGYPKLSIYNCYTQEFYGRDGKQYANVDAIQRALTSILQMAAVGDEIVHMPEIGCGLGGLDWDTEIKPMVSKLANCYGVDVYVHRI